jgi:hypothetical protein
MLRQSGKYSPRVALILPIPAAALGQSTQSCVCGARAAEAATVAAPAARSPSPLQTARVDSQQLGQDRHPLSNDGGGGGGGCGGAGDVDAAPLRGEICDGAFGTAAWGGAGCSGLSTRQVRTPFSSLQTGQMWPSGHGLPSCACAATQRAETMIPMTAGRVTAIHLLLLDLRHAASFCQPGDLA